MFVSIGKALILPAVLFGTLAVASAQEPVVTQAPGTAVVQTAPMTKKEMKDQRKQQKDNEKAASESAKAQKAQAKAQKAQSSALKHQDKSTNAQEKSAMTPAVVPAPSPQ